jgi:calmodulin
MTSRQGNHSKREEEQPQQAMEVLTPSEINNARRLFDMHDADSSGGISVFELVHIFQEMNASNVSPEDIMKMLIEVNCSNDAELSWEHFLQLQRIYKMRFMGVDQDPETIGAFVALGGNPDRTGQISTDKLVEVVKELGLTIEVARLIKEYDTDGSGFVDYDELAQMLKE